MKIQEIITEAPMEYEGEREKQPINPIGVIRQVKGIKDIADKPGGLKKEVERQATEYIKNKTRDDASSRNRAGDKENQITGMWDKLKGIFSKD